MYEVCCAWKCQVAGPVFSGTKMLIARSLSAGTSRSTGSLSIGAPGGMVTDGSRLKVNVRSDPGTMASPASRRAM